MADASRMFALTGQVAVVTGAGRGIGRGIATALAEAGADIVAVGRHPADALADHVGRVGRRCHSLVLDLSDPAQVEAVIPRAVAAAGRVDILVNNAGATTRGPALDVTPEDWHRVLQVNVHAVFRLCQAAAREMLPRRRGKIVNIATDLTRPLQEDTTRNPAILARIPAGRWGRPEDLGGAAVFLASAASDYIHGHLLAVDGGWL